MGNSSVLDKTHLYHERKEICEQTNSSFLIHVQRGLHEEPFVLIILKVCREIIWVDTCCGRECGKPKHVNEGGAELVVPLHGYSEFLCFRKNLLFLPSFFGVIHT